MYDGKRLGVKDGVYLTLSINYTLWKDFNFKLRDKRDWFVYYFNSWRLLISRKRVFSTERLNRTTTCSFHGLSCPTIMFHGWRGFCGWSHVLSSAWLCFIQNFNKLQHKCKHFNPIEAGNSKDIFYIVICYCL